ncbi:hypothetical protein XELAEV_18041651mg [Xenopus laevis]|nr:hypothetical protein XELAEV_18041651mg [Xenopus laevis]
MAFQRANGMSIIQALAMTVAEIPVFLYTTFGQSTFLQFKLSPGLRKVLFATAFGTVALALAAHQLKRRKHKKKQITADNGGLKPGGVPGSVLPVRRASSTKKGMELFEEALHKWEQALNLGQRCRSNTPSNELQDQNRCEGLSEDSQSRQFEGRLEALLHRAYNLQEEFGTSIPPDNLLMDLEGSLMFPLVECRRALMADDEGSTTSEDSFFSAAELFDTLQLNEVPFLPPKPAAAYEEALKLVHTGEVACRTLRTDLLGCYNDQDFLAKLHCVRQAFEVLLLNDRNQLFFSEVGKQMVAGLMQKAEKNPKGFLENYEEMLRYALKEDTWPTTQKELKGRGVVCMNFFDIALDFILMDAFEDLESPPSSVIAVLRNRWLSDSFKETALATACWSVLKAKRRLLMVSDGFISHFYSVSEHVSPVLAFGFLGPKEHLTEVCNFFKNQIVQYLKDMFDLDKVRYTTIQSLAEDILHLSRRRSDILLGYLGVETVREMNGAVSVETTEDELGL